MFNFNVIIANFLIQVKSVTKGRPTGYTPFGASTRSVLGATHYAWLNQSAEEQSALASLMSELTDSASLDYVADTGYNGRAVLRSRPKGAPTTKRGQPQGLTSFCWWTI